MYTTYVILAIEDPSDGGGGGAGAKSTKVTYSPKHFSHKTYLQILQQVEVVVEEVEVLLN